MKTYNSKFLWIAAVSLAFASCADDELQPFQAEEPENIHQLDYLDAYGPLKSYVDRAANPGFKLGVAVDEAGFIDKGIVYSMASSNFEDITPGNAMKHSSVVNAEGEMDFTTVKELIETAKGAGMSIYGHTLCWHSQQQADYLNGLIADKVLPDDPSAEPVEPIEVEVYSIDYSDYESFPFYVMGYTPEFKDGCLVSSYPGAWYQYFVADQIRTIGGDDYRVKIRIKSTVPGTFNLQFGQWEGKLDVQFNVTEDWAEATIDFNDIPDTSGSSFVVLQPGNCEGEVSIEWLKVYHMEIPAESTGTKMPVLTADFNEDPGDKLEGWNGWGGWDNGGNNSTRKYDADGGYEGSGAYYISNPSASTNTYDKQISYDFSDGVLEEGTEYYLNIKVKGSVDGQLATSFQRSSDYAGRGSFGNLSIKANEWTEQTLKATVNGEGANRLLFDYGHYAGDFWIDDVELYWIKPDNLVEIPDEEKKELIRAALEDFIKGMMEACGGYVKVWDVVNEPMSDDNPSALKGEKFSKRESNDHFYWQDYLGEDYARYAVEYARKYFKEYGGNEEELLLFVNDYNLEASYNSNAKCEGLINMINYWESDGKTRIDGIGTQLHVSYSISPTQQKRNEECIVKMFELLAASRKKIKISEIDLGLTGADGKEIVSTNPPLIHQLGQAEYYNFIIRKYFEIIPAEQRYGITLWSMTDSPNTEYSFWRKGQPIGLWDLNYNRKPAYAGFAEGLAGKDAPVPEEYSYLFTEEAAEGGE